MAPGYHLDSPEGSDPDYYPSSASEGTDDNNPVPQDLSALEMTYQESAYELSPEVDAFASALDRCSLHRGSVAERRAQIFRLVDYFYSFTKDRYTTLQTRLDLERESRNRKKGWQVARRKDGATQEPGAMDVDGGEDTENYSVNPAEVNRLRDESQVWDLLRRLLPLRYDDSTGASAQPSTAVAEACVSRREHWNHFMLTDSLARERKAILEWLQTSANDGPPIEDLVKDLQKQSDRGDIMAHGWLHTRLQIKQMKTVNGWGGVIEHDAPEVKRAHKSDPKLVTQLDPDAPTRQSRELKETDQNFEKAIWLGCFEMLRRGRGMDEIREWCSERTESWRAATISGLPLCNPEDEDVTEYDPVSTILWRRLCHVTATQGGGDDNERAVFGLLAGDIKTVEKLAKSWDDFLFAQFNALIRAQFDQYLINRAGGAAAGPSTAFPSFNAVQLHGDPDSVGKRLISIFKTRDETKEEAQTPFKSLQGVIIADELERHLSSQGQLIAYARQPEQRPVNEQTTLFPLYGVPKFDHGAGYFSGKEAEELRLLAHVLIVVSTLDGLREAANRRMTYKSLDKPQRFREHCIAAYVSWLRLSGHEELIPLYCSTLEGDRLYVTLSRNLINVVGRDARQSQIAIMRKLGIDTTEFVRRQPAIYMEDVEGVKSKLKTFGALKALQQKSSLKFGRHVEPDFFGEDADDIEQPDELVVRSLEWLMFDPGLLVETLLDTVRAYKHFLRNGNLKAARILSDRLPSVEIIRAKLQMPLTDDTAWYDEYEATGIPEEVLSELNVNRDTLDVLVRSLVELESLVKALDAMETLASLAQLTREENNNPARSLLTSAGQTIKVARAYMKVVLKGWLLNAVTSDDKDVFDKLRAIYLTETVLIYVSSLHYVGSFLSRDSLLECMELAATIAEDGSDVARAFVDAGRMKELVESFAAASKALAILSTEKHKPASAGQTGASKKMREMGWSRELWSVDQ